MRAAVKQRQLVGKLVRLGVNCPCKLLRSRPWKALLGQEQRARKRTLHRSRLATKFVSIFLAELEIGGTMLFVNAGHPRPLFYSARQDRWTLLDDQAPCCADQCPGIRNLPLGVIAETAYSQFAVKLAKGDLAVIYTDSLIEATDASGRQLGEPGLLALAREHCTGEPDVVGRRLLEAVAAYRGGDPADDDLTLIVLHHNAADPPAHSLGEWVRVMARMTGLVKV